MKEHFVLTVPKSSILHLNGTSTKLDDVPDNAVELWKSGTSTLALKSTGKELIEKLSKSEIEELIKIRAPFNYNSELKILREVLKSLNSSSRKAK